MLMGFKKNNGHFWDGQVSRDALISKERSNPHFIVEIFKKNPSH